MELTGVEDDLLDREGPECEGWKGFAKSLLFHLPGSLMTYFEFVFKLNILILGVKHIMILYQFNWYIVFISINLISNNIVKN